MHGNDQVRFCELCSLHVYNFAELTQREAESLITKTEGRICARLYRRPDGTVITKDCPVGLRAIRRRVARFAGAAFATLLSLGSLAMGQKPLAKGDGCKQQIHITRKPGQTTGGTGVISGTILDPIGAVVQAAQIKIIHNGTGEVHQIESDSNGRFLKIGLQAGSYNVLVKSPGFRDLKMPEVKLDARETIIAEMTLLLALAEDTVFVGVLVDSPLIDRPTPGTTIISGDLIRMLPKP